MELFEILILALGADICLILMVLAWSVNKKLETIKLVVVNTHMAHVSRYTVPQYIQSLNNKDLM